MKKLIFHIFITLVLSGNLAAQIDTIHLQPLPDNAMGALVRSNDINYNGSGSSTLQFSRNKSDLERSLLKFNLADPPPGVDIISAKLTLHGVNHNTKNPGTGVLQLVGDSWDYDAVTWNLSSFFRDTAMPYVTLAPPSSATQDYVLDVTAMVQSMVNTPAANFGWMLYMSDESDGDDMGFVFGSGTNSTAGLRPELEIIYCEHLVVNAYVSPSSDATSSNAGVSLSVSKGVPPYSFLWSNSATTKDIYNIAPGMYDVTITDGRGVHTSILVPVTSECGSITYTVHANSMGYQGSYKTALLNMESLNDYPSKANYSRPSKLTAYEVSGSSGVGLGRTMLAFDMKALPNNMQVNSASLKLTNTHDPYVNPFTLQLARVIQDWDERTVAFNDNINYATGDVLEMDYDASQSSYNFDVTNHLQQMLGGVNSSQGWILKLKNEGADGVGHVAEFEGNPISSNSPMLVMQLTYSNLFCDDTKLNWNQQDSYDENGNVIGSQKIYLDNLGRQSQKLVKNATNEVFRTQTLYDAYGNTAITTLPAYTGNQLKYEPGFVRNQFGQNYSLSDFDFPGTYNSPTALETGVYNTLGNYYSDNNPYDANQATATNPYTRIKYSARPGGDAISTSKPGNAFETGSGRESYNFGMSCGDELKYVFGYTATPAAYNSYKVKRNASDYLDNAPIVVSEPLVATKQIVITPDNLEMITYNAGGKVIASCYSGLSSGEVCTNITGVTSMLSYQGTRSADIHLPDANKSSMYLPLPSQAVIGTIPATGLVYTITDLYTDKLLTAGSDYTIDGSRHVIFGTAFLAGYTGRSLVLRVSYDYAPSYVSSAFSRYGVTPSADAKVTYDLSYGHFSKNYYDLNGNLRRSVSPKGFNCDASQPITMSTTYDYSHREELIAQKTPDQGLVEVTYDTEGKKRFSQNAEQKLNNRFSYINYDKHGRVVETGENQSTTGGGGFSYSYWFNNYYGQTNNVGAYHTNSIIDQQDGLYASEKTNTTTTGYTIPDAGNDIPSGYTNYAQYHNQFRNGPVSYVKNTNSTVWYNYDAFDRPLATITQVTEADFVVKKPNVDDQIKTSESDYNYFTGLVNSSTYQSNNPQETLELQMTYDANYRNTLTQLGYSGITQNLSANYYNKMGQVNRVVLGNNYQGLDYVYTLNGGLKAVNHPGLDPTLDPGHDNDNYGGGNSGVNQDLFGEIIEYYHNDYERSGTNMGSSIVSGSSRYNGLIYGVRYKTRDKVNAQTTGASYIDLGTSQTTLISNTNYGQQELRFAYEYDEFNRFGKSTFGLFNNSTGVFTSRTDYSEGGSSGYVGYDRNGNITALKRQAYVQSGSLVTLDDLSYTNGSANNRLTAITDAAVNSFASGVNFKTPSTSSSSAFTYNTIGQLTASPAENISSITYFPDGKPKKITFTNSNTSEFEYGANGQKIKAKLYNAGTTKYKYTWYVGPYIYEYDQSVTPAVFHITEARVGGQLLRVPSGGDLHNAYLVFQLTDHLGNVRATFKGSGTGNGIEILSYADYYAFGGVMPGRNWTLESDRYGYQGQEKAQDGTIWDQFELRAYNHDIGRWFTPDPYGQFASPYIAMANNPVSNIDPDGGQVPVFEPGKEPRGLLERKRERDDQSGAYAPLEVQKRYRDEIENIRKEYLVQGLGADIPGYLNAVKATNDLYCGLAEAFHWMGFGGVASGIDYLTQTQIGNNQMLCLRNGMQSESVGAVMKIESDPQFDRQLDVNLGIDKTASTANEEGQPGQSKIAISGDGEVNPKAESTAKELPNSEGSENQTTFDESGEKQNSESEKQSAETEESLENKHQDFIIILNDLEGANGAGHLAILIGSDAHKFRYLSKDGGESGSSGKSSNTDREYADFNEFLSDARVEKYDQFLFIPIDHTTMESMVSTMRTEIKSNYNLFNRNCGTAVENTLRKNGQTSVPTFLVPNLSFTFIQQTTPNAVYIHR